MTNFSIALSKDETESEGDVLALGTLTIGSFVEDFRAPLSYWDRGKYLFQWQDALRRLLAGEDRSALITTMYDPKTANFIAWWVVHLVGDNVHFQNHVLFLNELDEPFDEHDLYKSIPPRETHTEDGEPVSEWVINLSEIEEYADRLA